MASSSTFTALDVFGLSISPLWTLPPLLLLLLLLKLIHYTNFRDYNPSKLPIHGVPPGIFGRLRAIPSVYIHSFDLFDKGFARYQTPQKDGTPPTAFLAPHHLVDYVHVLPASLLPELKSIPEEVLSLAEAVDEDLTLSTIFGSTQIVTHPYHANLIRYKLTANLAKVYPDLDAEVSASFKDWEKMYLGSEEGDADGWVPLPVVDRMMDVVTRVSNRMFSGYELCYNKEFLHLIHECIMNLIFAGMGLSAFPASIHPYIAPFITFNFKRKLRGASKILEPVIKGRVKLHENGLKNPEEKSKEPDDMLQYVVEEARNLGPDHYNLDSMSTRYVLINLASVHSTATTSSWCLLHLAGHKPLSGNSSYWDTLHQEILAVDASSEEGPGVWTKRKLNKLVGLDSFLKESIAHSMASTLAMLRKCKKKGGHTFSNGLWVKEGEIVGIAAEAIQRYHRMAVTGKDVDGFDGFRYSRPYQELEGASTTITGGIGHGSAVTTANEFLAFGHGKHACPGRFFAVDELKTVLRYMITNYELKPIDEIPPLGYFKGNTIPPMGIKVQMRKRRDV